MPHKTPLQVRHSEPSVGHILHLLAALGAPRVSVYSRSRLGCKGNPCKKCQNLRHAIRLTDVVVQAAEPLKVGHAQIPLKSAASGDEACTYGERGMLIP